MGNLCANGANREAEQPSHDSGTLDADHQPAVTREETGAWLRGDVVGGTTTPPPNDAAPAPISSNTNNNIIAPSRLVAAMEATNNKLQTAGKRPSGPKMNPAAFTSMVPQSPALRRTSDNELQSTQADGAGILVARQPSYDVEEGTARPLGIAPKRVSLPQEEPEGNQWNYPTGSVLSISSERGEGATEGEASGKQHHF
ncbi:MAG: hypothetical protein COA68_17675 [Oceanobacter sp.]|nr:MAG: hypothetical protein COA68_17675 [Oceanobacter sp.]